MLCRDIYHCTPKELDDLDYETVMKHLICIGAESDWKKQESKWSASRG